MTSGADDWTGIEVFGVFESPWLREFLKLPNGIPSHDTFTQSVGYQNCSIATSLPPVCFDDEGASGIDRSDLPAGTAA